MPNVNALKKITKKKVNSSDLSPTLKKLAKRNINTMKIKQRTSPGTAQQKVYFTLLKTNNRLASSSLNSEMLQRLSSVKPLPNSVKKSIKKSSPNTSGRTARKKEKKAELTAAGIVLGRMGIPRGPSENIFDRLLRSR